MIRKATLEDTNKVIKLISYYAGLNEMLPRSLNYVVENIRDFFVYEREGKVYGCAALHLVWMDLGEIKSLAVEKSKTHKGIGSKLLNACVKEARQLGLKKLFVLTYKPEFFERFGFERIRRSRLPRKIWTECISCVKFPKCDEQALLKWL